MANTFITVRGTDRVLQRLNRLAGPDALRVLHERIATRILGWVVQNVEAEGLERKWASLSPNTVYGRRMSGKGGGARAMRNSGQMMQSLNKQADANAAVVGFGSKTAVFHQFGTKGPYEIAPRFKQALSFPSLWTRSTARQTLGSRRFAGLFQGGSRPAFAQQLGKATVGRLWMSKAQGTRPGAMGRMTSFQKAGRSRADMGRLNFVTVKRVIKHPGLAARPLLPSPTMARQIATEVARNFIREKMQGGAGAQE